MREWWPQVDPREVLLWLADAERVRRYARACSLPSEVDLLGASFMRRPRDRHVVGGRRRARRRPRPPGSGPCRTSRAEERGFYEIEELDDLTQYGVTEVRASRQATPQASRRRATAPADARERLLTGRIGAPDEYAHVLVDEAQDLSPMQWRMLGRRGRYCLLDGRRRRRAGVVAGRRRGRPARARRRSASQERRLFHMDTNYRNAREIFDYARRGRARARCPTPTSRRRCARPGSTRSR